MEMNMHVLCSLYPMQQSTIFPVHSVQQNCKSNGGCLLITLKRR
uniref:Uncharacterized protein n=1 Tax=Arundo donax TaxID=35708 RepID=A0A0A9H6L2_ARUDO